jgi:uncharacterized protein
MKDAIIIFVRNPEMGKVKTRLAAGIGNEKALKIYKLLLEHTEKITALLSSDKHVFYHQQITENDIWDAPGFFKKLQADGDLGSKMKTAFKSLFAEGYSKIVIIGSDCFELTSAKIEEAFSKLEKNNAVIGPAKDGGYYLLGLKKLIPALFENISWSTENVFSESLHIIKQKNLQFHVLPTLTDVDTIDDLPQDLGL